MIYRALIHERLTEGFIENGTNVPPNEKVVSFLRTLSLDSLVEENRTYNKVCMTL